MRQKGQTLPYNDQEIALIKNVFSENEDLLFAIRKVFLQVELDEAEIKLIRDLSPEAKAFISKKFYPEVNPDVPLGFISHMISGLFVDIRGITVKDARQFIEAKKIQMDYIKQQLQIIEDIDALSGQTISLEGLKSLDNKNDEQAYIDVIAWNNLIGYIDQNLIQIKGMAEVKNETPEEMAKRLRKDSTK